MERGYAVAMNSYSQLKLDQLRSIDELSCMDLTGIANRYQRVWRLARVLLWPLLTFALPVIAVSSAELGAPSFLADLNDKLTRSEFFIVLAVFLLLLAATFSVGSYGFKSAGLIVAAGIFSIAFFFAPVMQGIADRGIQEFFADGIVLTILTLSLLSLFWYTFIAALLSAIQLWRPIPSPRRSELFIARSFKALANQRRTQYSSLRRVWAYLAATGAIVSLMGAAGIAFFGVFIQQHLNKISPVDVYKGISSTDNLILALEEYPGWFLFVAGFGFVIYAAVALFLVFVYRVVRRLMQRRAYEFAQKKTYVPIVYLRSFRDEDKRVQPISYAKRALRIAPSLEEVVVKVLSGLGPPIAIGLPGEKRRRLGAMRAFYSDDDWKNAFVDWTARAQFVILTIGETKWSLWELQYLLAERLEAKVVFVMPVDTVQTATDNRWKAFVHATIGTRWHGGLQHVSAQNLRTLVLLTDGRVIAFRSKVANQAGYELAMRHGVVALLDSSGFFEQKLSPQR